MPGKDVSFAELVTALETGMHYHSAQCDSTERPLFSSHLNSDVKNGANFYFSSRIKLAAQETWDSNKIVENIGKAIPRKANTVKLVERKIMKIISVPGY